MFTLEDQKLTSLFMDSEKDIIKELNKRNSNRLKPQGNRF